MRKHHKTTLAARALLATLLFGDGYRVEAIDEKEAVFVHAASGVRQSVALTAPSILLGAPGARTPPKALREG